MTNTSADRPVERELLWAALDLPPEQREKFLHEESKGDAALLERLLILIQNAEAQSQFMEHPAVAMNLTTPIKSEVLGTRIGRYKLMEQIGEGGMGVVYVAEQTEPVRRTVALKLIKPGMDSKQVIARFEAERQALALMDHPNIARVIDAGTTDRGLPYFVMELVRGMPITEYCDKAKLSPNDRLQLFTTVCSAVRHAHLKGIIHRDLKPNNILVTLHDGVPVVKIIDFGVAKALNQQLTQHTIYTALNQVLGTPMYMSPEQLELSGLDIDTRTDVYSLGVLLYELLTGFPPFDRDALYKSGFDELRRIIREQDPPRPSQRITTLDEKSRSTNASHRGLDHRTFSKTLRGELDWIVMKALEKDRNRRYESASAMAADVRRYLDGDQVEACSPSVTYKIKKMTLRNRVAITTLALICLSLLLGSTIAIWQARRAMIAEATAKQRLASETAALKLEKEASRRAKEATKTEAIERSRATQAVTQSRIALAQSLASTGAKFLHNGNHSLALPWFVESLRINEENKQPTQLDRLRINMVLRQCLKPVAMLSLRRPSLGVNISGAIFDANGRAIALEQLDAYSLQLVDVFSGLPIHGAIKLNEKINYAKLSPGGDRLAVVDVNGEFGIWETARGEKLCKGIGAANWIVNCCFSHDGARLALLNDPDQLSRIIDSSTGEDLFSFVAPNGGSYPSMSHDLQQMVWLDTFDKASSPSLYHWSQKTGVRSIPTGSPRFGTATSFSRDGDKFAVATFASTAQIFNSETLQPVTEVVRHDDAIYSVLFTPNDAALITGSLDGTAKIWSSTTGALLTPPIRHEGEISVLATSLDGRWLATGGFDSTVRITDVATGELAYPIISCHDRVTNVSFHVGGRLVMTQTGEGVVQVWDIASAGPHCRIFDDHSSYNDYVSKLEKDRILIGGLAPRVWSVSDYRSVSPPLEGGALLQNADFSPSRRIMGISAREGKVQFWDSAAFQPRTPAVTANKSHETDRTSRPTFSTDEELALYVFRSHEPGSLALFNTRTGAQVDCELTREKSVNFAAFSPNKKFIVVGGAKKGNWNAGGYLSVWDANTFTLAWPRLELEHSVISVAISPDSRRIAFISNTLFSSYGRVQLLNLESGQQTAAPIEGTLNFVDVAFAPNGKCIATVDASRIVRFWDAQTSKPVFPPISDSAITKWVRFSPALEMVMTLSGTENLNSTGKSGCQLWDFSTAIPISPPLRHSNPTSHLWSGDFSDGGTHFVSHCRDGTTCVWDLEASELPCEELRRQAEIISGRRFVGSNDLSPLKGSELVAQFNATQELSPHWAAATEEQLIYWHFQQAVSHSSQENWRLAINHLDYLCERLPKEMVGPLARRLNAHIAVKDWTKAQEDLDRIAAAIGHGHPATKIFANNLAKAQDQSKLTPR